MFTLSSCLLSEPVGNDPIAIRRAADTLEFAVCESMTITSVFLQETRSDGEGQALWRVETSIQAEVGQGLTQANILPEQVSPEPQMKAGDVLLLRVMSDGTTLRAKYRVPEAGLNESLWLQTDGRQTTDPCE